MHVYVGDHLDQTQNILNQHYITALPLPTEFSRPNVGIQVWSIIVLEGV